MLTGVLAFAAWQGRIGDSLYGGAWTLGPWELHPLVLLFALSGTLMISKTLRIPKLNRGRRRPSFRAAASSRRSQS